jgi:hypothetical protein
MRGHDAVLIKAGLVKIEFRMDLDTVFLHAFFIVIFGSILVGNFLVDFCYFLTKIGVDLGQRRIV